MRKFGEMGMKLKKKEEENLKRANFIVVFQGTIWSHMQSPVHCQNARISDDVII